MSKTAIQFWLHLIRIGGQSNIGIEINTCRFGNNINFKFLRLRQKSVLEVENEQTRDDDNSSQNLSPFPRKPAVMGQHFVDSGRGFFM